MQGKNIVAKASLVYIIVSLINKGIGIITIPVFTRILSTAEMGTTTTWISWMTILLPITSLSLSSGSFFIAMKEFEGERDEYQSSVLSIITISTAVCLGFYVCFHVELNRLFTLETADIVVMFFYLLFSPAFEIWTLRKRYEYKVREMALVSVVVNITASLFAVVFVLLLRNKRIDLGRVRILATYGVLTLTGVFFYFLLLKKGRTLFKKKYWSFAVQVSAPLVIHSLAKNILDVSDRSMISILCGKDDVGIYGTLYQVSTISLIIWTAINNAFVPYLYERLENNDSKEISVITRISTGMILVYGACSIMMTAIAPEIVLILTTEQYYEAVYIIPPIASGIFLTCVYNLFADVILYHKKSVGVMLATLTAAITNIVLNATFIPIYGYQAAAYTTLFAFIVLSISQGVAMKHFHKDKIYDLKQILLISIIVIVICLSFNFVYANRILRIALIIGLVAVFVVFQKRITNVINQIKRR